MDYLKHLEDTVKVLLVTITALYSIAVGVTIFFRSGQLLHRCLYYERLFPAWRIMRELAFCLWHVRKTHSLFRAVRLRVELELLNPRPVRSFEKARNSQERFREWLKYRAEKWEWRQEIKSKLLELAEASRSDHRPLLEVDNCFSLYDHKDEIKRYLTVVSSLRGEEELKGRFIARIRIRDGYLMPMFLVTGLASHFNEDWKPVINDFSRTVDQGYTPLQVFLFDCWLVWGPSIPACTCSQWRRGVALQFGFGDENNSIPVYLPAGSKQVFLDSVLESMKRVRQLGENQPATGFRTSLTGTLQLGTMINNWDIAPAQEALLSPEFYDFVLEYEEHLEKAYQEKVPVPGYYSAYVWVMFEEEREPATPYETAANRQWLRLFPFWEHANIADESTYEALKLQLARKVLTFAGLKVAENPAFRLRYACAFDHSGCGQELLYQPAGKRIREIIQEEGEKPEFRDIREHLVFDDLSAPSEFASCHLPDVIANYYKDVEIYNEISRAKEISLHWQQLDATTEDREILEKFFRELIGPEFTEANTRRVHAALKRRLASKGAEKERGNRSHALVLRYGEKTVGGSVSHYLGEANAGVIEFLAVEDSWRNKGIGRRIIRQTEQMLRIDAEQSGGKEELDLIVAATEHPRVTGVQQGSLKAFERARVWQSWDFRMLDLPYDKLPAAPGRKAGEMLLIVKTINGTFEEAVPAERLKAIIRNYAGWTGGQKQPERIPEFQRVAEILDMLREVNVTQIISSGNEENRQRDQNIRR